MTRCAYLPGSIAMPSPTPNQVQNVGEEGFGYLSWIVGRWETLPPCAFLLHGGWKRRPRFWDMVVDLLPCALAPRERSALAVPLSHLFVESRRPPAGMEVLMQSVRAAGIGPDLLPDWLRRDALSYYATNVWFVTRAALRRKPYQLWAALRDAALVPGKPRSYSEPTQGAATTAHSSVALLYEHLFHVALGLPGDASEPQAFDR